MDLYAKYGLRHVINAFDKATPLGGARVLPEIAEVVAASLGSCFYIEDLQHAAGRVISEATGAESGCVTACSAAGITLGVAAAMTGADKAKVAQLPDTDGMPNRVIIQKGHCINFGGSVTQMIRLSGAEVVEAGNANSCNPWHIRHELEKGHVAAIVAVESYHTVAYAGVPLPELAAMAHEFGAPLIVDAATQELRLRELVATTEADLITCSAHKYFGALTGGVLAGRKNLIDAVLLQHSGIGRGMKVGKEGIIGVLAAFEARMWNGTLTWAAEDREKIERVLDTLKDTPGLAVEAHPDANGCPFLIVRFVADWAAFGHTRDSFKAALAEGNPSVVVRAYGHDKQGLWINTTEMDEDEIPVLCGRIRSLLAK